MAQYLIEIRFIDRRAKKYMKSLAGGIYRKYRLGNKHHVPHVTLVGGLDSSNEERLIKDVTNLCVTYPVMHFKLKGFSSFQNKVVFLDIDPSERLKEFRYELSKILNPYCKLKYPWDFQSKQEFVFHATIAMNIPPGKFEPIRNYLNSLDLPIKTEYVLARVSIIKDIKILKEYDFLQRRLLNRFEAKNPFHYRKTQSLLTKYLNQSYDPNRSIKSGPFVENEKISYYKIVMHPAVGKPMLSPSVKSQGGILQRLKNIVAPKRTFIIADLHLDHKNIIHLCNRPFSSTEKMNSELVTNWNSIVRKKDTVYFIGDLVYGRSSRSADFWIEKLNGKIILIKGNHDHSENLTFLDKEVIDYRGKKFLLIHDPANIPEKWENWTIHGHQHNNDLKEFPLINGRKKTINASVEVINYFPLSLDSLFDMEFEHISYLRDIKSPPQKELDNV